MKKHIVIKLRVSPSQLKLWSESLKKLGVIDFSSFARGAIQGAIETSFRAKDPIWKVFVQKIQPVALKVLGYGVFDGDAKDVEGYGTERSGTSADDFIKSLDTDTKPVLAGKETKAAYKKTPLKFKKPTAKEHKEMTKRYKELKSGVAKENEVFRE